MSKTEIKWRKYPEEKPKNNSNIPYLVTWLFDAFGTKEPTVDMFYYEEDSFKWNPENEVIAWAYMPEPYNPKENNNESR